MRRSAATSSVISWRRWSPDWRASSWSWSIPSLSLDDLAGASRRCRCRLPRGRRGRAAPRALAQPLEHLPQAVDPLAVGVGQPRCSSRWRAWFKSPWASSSSVSSASMSSASKSADPRAVPAAGSRSATVIPVPRAVQSPAARRRPCSAAWSGGGPRARTPRRDATTPGSSGPPVSEDRRPRAGTWRASRRSPRRRGRHRCGPPFLGVEGPHRRLRFRLGAPAAEDDQHRR